MHQFKYKAFISYSHRDSQWAGWLHRAIESYRPPKHLIGQVTDRGEIPKQLSPVFRDREELPSATDLGAVISTALRDSACQIVICSPHAAQSRWVNEEILAFKRLGGENRIFCLIVGGEPNASDDPKQFARECFPQALRFKLGPDGNLSSERTEPIAADAREGKDGKYNAKLKVISGMLGVGFDALRQRELQRRHRQMAMIATGAFSGMVIAVTLAAAALVARANAERQRVRAEAEAETARQTTSFLVDLFRVSDPGEARGNSITAREMLDKGAGKIDSELVNQPAIQATLMDTVGTVYMRLGLYDQAHPLLEGALARRRQLRSTADQLAGSMNNLGELLSLRADYQSAEKHYRDALALKPEAGTVQDDAATIQSRMGLGTVLANQGRFEEAEAELRSALDLEQTLHQGPHVQRAQILKDLSWVVYQRGDLKGAIPIMEESVQMQRQLRGEQPHPDTLAAINDLGLLLHADGQYDRAEQLLGESLAMAHKLLGDKHPDIANSLNNLAFLLHDKGDYSRAEVTYRQALTMQRELVGEVHPDVANSLSNLAFLLHDKGELKGALGTLRESLEITRKLFEGDHPATAKALHTMGYWLMEQGEYQESEALLVQALDMRRRLLGQDHPDVASTLTHLAMLKVATGRYSEAANDAQIAVGIFTFALSETHWRTAVAQSVTGAALTGLGRFAEAEKLLLKSKATLDADEGALPDYRRWTDRYLVSLYTQWRRPEEANRYAVQVKTKVKIN